MYRTVLTICSLFLVRSRPEGNDPAVAFPRRPYDGDDRPVGLAGRNEALLAVIVPYILLLDLLLDEEASNTVAAASNSGSPTSFGTLRL